MLIFIGFFLAMMWCHFCRQMQEKYFELNSLGREIVYRIVNIGGGALIFQFSGATDQFIKLMGM